jgi:recombination associated protein RdgC
MFFKNMTAFKIEEGFDKEKFTEDMTKMAFIPCSGLQRSTKGFVNPLVKSDECIYSFNNIMLFCLLTEEKILPASVINEQAQIRIEELESGGERIGKSQKTEIKEQIEQQLLPQAFSRHKRLFGYFDLTNNYLIFDSANSNQVNEAIEQFRKVVDFLKVTPLIKEETDALTSWFVDNGYPIDIEIGEKCKLVSDAGDGVANISCQGSTMLTDNIKSFIETGGHITEMAVVWKEQLSMNINSNLQFKAIKFLDGVKDLNDSDDLSGLYKQEADLLIMSDIFAELLTSVQDWNMEND